MRAQIKKKKKKKKTKCVKRRKMLITKPQFFSFSVWLVGSLVRDFWTNHGAKLSNTEAILDYSIEPLNFVFQHHYTIYNVWTILQYITYSKFLSTQSNTNLTKYKMFFVLSQVWDREFLSLH